MAKLTLIALTLTAIVAFCAVSAYKTTITTTTVMDNNRKGSEQDQCSTQIPMEKLNHCEMHLTQGIISEDKLKMVVINRQFQQGQQHLQQCCNQLYQVSEECQCDAIQQVYDEARQQSGVIKMRQMLTKAQRLPTDCKLEIQDCPIASPRV